MSTSAVRSDSSSTLKVQAFLQRLGFRLSNTPRGPRADVCGPRAGLWRLRCESLNSSEDKSFHGFSSSVSFISRAVRDSALSCVDFHRPRVVGSPGRLGADLSVTHRPARPPACDREGLPVTHHARCVLRAACCARARAVGCVRGPALCVGCASPAGLARI